MNYLKLVRLPNLLFLGLVISAMFWCVLDPMLAKLYCIQEIPQAGLIFGLMLCAALFTAASGYVINDYFDTKIDEINRPTQVIVGHGVSRQQAATFFTVLLCIGLAAGLALSFLLKSLILSLIYVGMAGALWFYSSSYKRMLIVGNLIVSLCVFMAVFLVGYVVFIALRNEYEAGIQMLVDANPAYYNSLLRPFYSVLKWSAAFGAVAALLTWMREIVKDLQDRKGDAEMECRTMAIVWGEKVSKVVITLLAVATVVLISWLIRQLPFGENQWTHYAFAYVFMPAMVASIVGLWMAKNIRDYRILSNVLKGIMLLGTLYMPLLAYLFSTLNPNC
ncbi:MAG: geranylgeranylglycerol-phosphate geranylgeranyltransferase [Paludibacteraceae bacterium]|nr:geranylgeranylglycerol-phosphate geranylgeranyltransferase [Paludibacteraceae bacterium]